MDSDQTTGPSSADRPIEHHEIFYFRDDPMAIFLVEDRLFKVHRHYLIQESKVFCDMFSAPPEGTEVEGMNDDQPIHLPDVTVKEFELLLKHFYILPGDTNDRSVPKERVQEESLSLLGVAHRFAFERIVNLALKVLKPDKLPIITRIHLGEKYELEEWLFSAYEALLDRKESLSSDEALALGPERVICFIKARDFMHHERMDIAQTDLRNERSRARNLEQQIQNHGIHWNPSTFGIHSVIPSRPPTDTAAVARKFFC